MVFSFCYLPTSGWAPYTSAPRVFSRVLEPEFLVERQAGALLVMQGALVAFAFDLALYTQIRFQVR
jgi:hypothetical protein